MLQAVTQHISAEETDQLVGAKSNVLCWRHDLSASKQGSFKIFHKREYSLFNVVVCALKNMVNLVVESGVKCFSTPQSSPRLLLFTP